GEAGAADHRIVRGAARSQDLQGRVSGGAEGDHRREDRRPGNRRPGGGSAAEGREPDGGAQEEPRRGERSEETSRQSRRREARRQTKTCVAESAAGPRRTGGRRGQFSLRRRDQHSREWVTIT